MPSAPESVICRFRRWAWLLFEPFSPGLFFSYWRHRCDRRCCEIIKQDSGDSYAQTQPDFVIVDYVMFKFGLPVDARFTDECYLVQTSAGRPTIEYELALFVLNIARDSSLVDGRPEWHTWRRILINLALLNTLSHSKGFSDCTDILTALLPIRNPARTGSWIAIIET